MIVGVLKNNSAKITPKNLQDFKKVIKWKKYRIGGFIDPRDDVITFGTYFWKTLVITYLYAKNNCSSAYSFRDRWGKIYLLPPCKTGCSNTPCKIGLNTPLRQPSNFGFSPVLPKFSPKHAQVEISKGLCSNLVQMQ